MEINEQKLLLRKSIQSNRIKIVADVVLIMVFLLIAWYIVSNIEFAKTMNGDVCRICEAKTGGKCLKTWTAPERKVIIFDNVTLIPAT